MIISVLCTIQTMMGQKCKLILRAGGNLNGLVHRHLYKLKTLSKMAIMTNRQTVYIKARQTLIFQIAVLLSGILTSILTTKPARP